VHTKVAQFPVIPIKAPDNPELRRKMLGSQWDVVQTIAGKILWRLCWQPVRKPCQPTATLQIQTYKTGFWRHPQFTVKPH
jgi:hypothetical protein